MDKETSRRAKGNVRHGEPAIVDNLTLWLGLAGVYGVCRVYHHIVLEMRPLSSSISLRLLRHVQECSQNMRYENLGMPKLTREYARDYTF